MISFRSSSVLVWLKGSLISLCKTWSVITDTQQKPVFLSGSQTCDVAAFQCMLNCLHFQSHTVTWRTGFCDLAAFHSIFSNSAQSPDHTCSMFVSIASSTLSMCSVMLTEVAFGCFAWDVFELSCWSFSVDVVITSCIFHSQPCRVGVICQTLLHWGTRAILFALISLPLWLMYGEFCLC